MACVNEYPVVGQPGTTQYVVEDEQPFTLVVSFEDDPSVIIPSVHDGIVNFAMVELTGSDGEVAVIL
jgi:hypothetical protein